MLDRVNYRSLLWQGRSSQADNFRLVIIGWVEPERDIQRISAIGRFQKRWVSLRTNKSWTQSTNQPHAL